MDNLPTTESPATRMESLKQDIADIESGLDDLNESKSRIRQNFTLNAGERNLLLSALDIKIVQGEREHFRMKAKLATQLYKFQKETFWSKVF